MTGRVYLDWNASAPLRPEARAAMLAALDLVGNPSSVHAEGRAAWAVVERARAQVARLVGVDPDRIVFTSGATEANAMGAGPRGFVSTEAEHPSVTAHRAERTSILRAGPGGVPDYDPSMMTKGMFGTSLSLASSAHAVGVGHGETGALADRDAARGFARSRGLRLHWDAAQAAGRVALDVSGRHESAALSAHKLGGPKGVGAFLTATGAEPDDRDGPLGLRGGGQEGGWRAGTQNLVGIAGFGAAAEASSRDLEAGSWEGVARLRDILEDRLAAAAPDAIIVAREVPRLPNTTCVIVPGWRGEMQVMQLDLAGFAVSAGAACNSGKVGPSRALTFMGYDDVAAASAIRVSLGPTTTEEDIARFADAWSRAYRSRRKAAA